MPKTTGDEVVVFDFSRVGRSWNRDFFKTMSDASRAELVLNRTLPEDASDEDYDALYAKQEKAFDDLEQLSDRQAGLLVQVLADVPRAWLIEGSPKVIDWSKVESLDYIQADRYLEIYTQLRERNSGLSDSKNSDGHTPSRQKRRGR